MSEPTPEAIEVAAEAYRTKVEWIERHSRDDYGREAELAMRAALSAAAPYLIREAQAQALEDAAVMVDPDDDRPLFLFGWRGRNLLRARAAAIRDGGL
jgi:hypothetical protein